ncbi:MAG: BrnT family toxin [Rhodospirillales bacterium]
MDIVFDPNKDASNKADHDGISLQFGADVLDDPNALDIPDIRFDYGEDRWIAYGRVELTVYVCVYVEHEDHYRIISVRKATQVEEQRYYNEQR